MPHPIHRFSLLSLFALSAASCRDDGIMAINASPDALIVSHHDGDRELEGYPVVFEGVASDPDDSWDRLEATWKLDGRVICQETPGEDGSTACEMLLAPDEAKVQLLVQDPRGAAAEYTVLLFITSTEAPSAEIVSPQLGGRYYSDWPVELVGEVSDGEDPPEALLVAWDSDLDGDLGEAWPDSSGQVNGSTYLSQGVHTLSLYAEDLTGKSATDTVTIQVGPPNSSPLCEVLAPESGSAGEQGTAVTFQALVSDPDISADNLVVTWESDHDGVLGTSTPYSSGEVEFTTSDLSTQTHNLTLTVVDELGASCTDGVRYTVGTAPLVEITAPADGDVANEGQTVTFSAMVSDSEDSASVLELGWTSDLDGELSTAGADSTGAAGFTSAALNRGEHTITLVATDSHGLSSQDRVRLTINGLPAAPTCSISPDPAVTSDALSASVDTPSVDPEGDAVTYSYAWSVEGVDTGERGASLASSWFARDDRVVLTVTPSDGHGAGSPCEAELVVSNTPPELASATVGPAGATTTDDLSCTPGTATDDDGDAVLYTYAWAVGGAAISETTSSLDASQTAKGDVVACTVTPSDGMDVGDPVTSGGLVIQNSAPSIGSVSIDPDPATALATLSCSYADFVDVDGDDDASTWEWTVDGAVVSYSATLEGLFVGGQEVTCTVTPDDGEDEGAPVSASIVIANSPPGVEAVSISPDPAYAGDELSCSWSGFSDPDGDADASTVQWAVNGDVVGTGTTLLGGFVGGDMVTCTVTPSDGEDEGTPVEGSLTISNTPPEVVSLEISPASPRTNDVVAAVVATSDVDGDSVTLSYAWYVNGTSTGVTSSTLAGATWFDRDDRIAVVVTPSDEDAGDPATSAEVIVVNTAPEAPEVSISPSAPSAGYDDLLCTVDADSPDADGDAITYTVTWTVDGVAYPDGDSSMGWEGPDSTTLSDDTVPAWDLVEGQVWTCVVTPDDGLDEGASASATVTVGEGCINPNTVTTPDCSNLDQYCGEGTPDCGSAGFTTTSGGIEADIGEAAILDLSTGWTVEAWIKPDEDAAPSNSTIVGQFDGSATTTWDVSFAYSYGAGVWRVVFHASRSSCSASYFPTNEIPLGEWSHVAWVGTPTGSSTLRHDFYVNGEGIGSSTSVTCLTTTPSSAPLEVGTVRSASYVGFPGLVDGVRIATEPLYAGEFEPSVVTPFPECFDLVWELDGDALDSSGNSHDGTNMGATWEEDSAECL